MTDNSKPLRRTLKKISDVATEFLKNGSGVDFIKDKVLYIFSLLFK